MGRKVANVYETRKVGEIHKKSDNSWVFWAIAIFFVIAVVGGN